jgi:hypothetical protein
MRTGDAVTGRECALEFQRELAIRSLAQRPLARRFAQLPNQVSTPAIVAVMNVAIEPPSTARSPRRARS